MVIYGEQNRYMSMFDGLKGPNVSKCLIGTDELFDQTLFPYPRVTGRFATVVLDAGSISASGRDNFRKNVKNF